MNEYPPMKGLGPKDRWLQLITSEDDTLHRASQYKEDESWGVRGGPGVTCCGLSGDLEVPGMFSRMYAQRCPECCKVVGIPEGQGIPLNAKIKEPEDSE